MELLKTTHALKSRKPHRVCKRADWLNRPELRRKREKDVKIRTHLIKNKTKIQIKKTGQTGMSSHATATVIKYD